MSYLIDTNVISELRRREPARSVAQWFALQDTRSLYLSVLTIGELNKGISKLQAPHKRRALLDWLNNDVRLYFSGRILGVDELVATRWGHLAAIAGRPLPVIDSLLAATALVHNLCLVTRNEADFAFSDLEVFNPWGDRE